MDDETVVISSINDLITWPWGEAGGSSFTPTGADYQFSNDPFGLISSLDADWLNVIEFSELTGPRLVFSIPPQLPAHFDANALAVNSMTSDFANSKGTRSFCVNGDVQVVSSNEELGVQSLANYFTLYDIEARGFVRPFCLIYSTPDPEKASRISIRLTRAMATAIEALKLCNRRRFLRQLNEALDFIDSLENQTISNYYGIYFEQQSPPSLKASRHDDDEGPSRNCASVKLYTDLRQAHAAIYQWLQSCPHVEFDECRFNKHEIDINVWLNRVVRGGGSFDSDRSTLAELSELASCSLDYFINQCNSILATFRRDDWTDRFVLCSPAAINSGNCPYASIGIGGGRDSVLLVFDASNQRNSNVDDTGKCSTKEDDDREAMEDCAVALKPMIHALPQLLYPVLTGRCFIVSGSESSRSLVQAVIRALALFAPSCSSSSHARTSPPVKEWRSDRVTPVDLVNWRLIGQTTGVVSTSGDSLLAPLESYASVMNVDSGVFNSVKYTGRILERISAGNGGRQQQMASGRLLYHYIASIISEYGLFAYVASHILSGRRKDCTTALGDMERRFRLGVGDMRIVQYMVEMITGAITKCASSADSMRLQYPSNFHLSSQPATHSLNL